MIQRMRDHLAESLLPPLVVGINSLLYRWNRFEIINEDIPNQFWMRGERVILCFWHDQLLLMNRGYRGGGAQVLVSPSVDGEIISRVMARFGVGSVRGSSSRDAGKAFRELLTRSREACDLVITPDGPKGPRHQVKPGAVRLARLTGRPVIPMSLACSRGRRFSSWDRFLLPYPFGRLVIRFGTPLYFHRRGNLDEGRLHLQKALTANSESARIALERHGVSAV